MRIVGGRDYYDHGLAYGVDETIVFDRNGHHVGDHLFGVTRTGGMPDLKLPEQEKRQRWSWRDREVPTRPRWTYKGTDYLANSVHVVLCGEYYHGVQLRSIATDQPFKDDHYSRKADWDDAEYMPYRHWDSETYWERNSLAKALARAGAHIKTEKPKGLWPSQQSYTDLFSRRRVDGEQLSWLLANGVTVATCNGDHTIKFKQNGRDKEEAEWQVNMPTLGLYHFIKVLDPVQAFQRISMWVGGVLPQPGAKMVQITDDTVKAAKHGMDKTSFRNPPGHKRGRIA